MNPTESNILPILNPARAETLTDPAEAENEMWMLAEFDGIETPEGDQTAIDTVRSFLTTLASDLAVAFQDQNIDVLLDLIIQYLIDPTKELYAGIYTYGSEKVYRFPTLGPDLIELRARHGTVRNYNAVELDWLDRSIAGSSYTQYASERFMGSVINASSQLRRVQTTIVDTSALKNSLRSAVLQQHNLGGREMQAGIPHLE